jgi:hypothetical protein
MARFAWLIGCAALTAVGCGRAEPTAPAATPASEAPPAAAAAPTRATKASLRCGDFFTAADGAALGLDASGYDADKTQTNPSLGVLCSMGPVGFTIFHGDAYVSMISGLDRGVEQGALVAEQGPTLGTASKWSSMGPMHSAMFLSTSKRYAGHVTALDKALLEKLARTLDANMK